MTMTAIASILAVLFLTSSEMAVKEVSPTIDKKAAANMGEDYGAMATKVPVKTKDKKESMSITATRGDFDREEGVAMFDGEVHVIYADEYHLLSDKLYVFFAGSNDVSRIVSMGGVVVSNAARVGYCETAVFRRQAKEIEMFGDERGMPAKLMEKGRDELAGSRIKFWIDEEQVEIGNSEITFEKGSFDVKKKGKGVLGL